MSGIWGNKIQLSIFGESHGPMIGITIHGLPPGLLIDMEVIQHEMSRRSPGGSALTSSRKERDVPEIISGVFKGKTTGAPLSCVIKNCDSHSGDYEKLADLPRPGHSDYPASVRYEGHQDYRGGGHFSGRLTAPLVFTGAVCYSILQQKGVTIGAHIDRIGETQDQSFSNSADAGCKSLSKEILDDLRTQWLPLLDRKRESQMKAEIEAAAQQGDSAGGIIQCAAVGIPAGLGEPFFDSVESVLSHLLFSIPAVKGVEFGDGFAFGHQRGSQCNDEYFYDSSGVIQTQANHNGGILGGLTTGMPLIFRTAVKPTPSIAVAQHTVNLNTGCNDMISVTGRHDPCIVIRAIPVVEAVCAIGLCQFIR